MSNLANIFYINSYELKEKMYKGQKVLTFSDIDGIHNRVQGTASRNFKSNKKHLIKNTDYFVLTRDEIRPEFNFGKNAPSGTLLTEVGYRMIVKSLTDPKAWDIQRELVDTYFSKATESKNSNANNDTLQQVLSKLSNLEKRFESLQQEKILDKQTISTLQSDLKFEKRQIHMSPIMEKRSRIYEELKSSLFYNEFNNIDTAETYNMALKILKSTYIKDIFATANFISENKSNKKYNSLDWAIAVLKVGYTILHDCNKDIYNNIASKNLLFYKDVNQKFCDEYEEAFIPSKKQGYLHKKIISRLPQGIELNGKILILCYFKTLDKINHKVNIRLNPTHLKVNSSITLNEYLMMLDISTKKINDIIKG